MIAKRLSRLFEDSNALGVKAHAFDCDVEESMFQPLHHMTMNQYTEILNEIDLICARSVRMRRPPLEQQGRADE